jgi:acetyl esterase/lipase
MVLMYPVIDMSGDIKHSGSMRNLIGEDASEAQVTRFSNQMQVTADTPPTILIHSVDDSGVPAANSVVFYEALVDMGVPAELHIFNSGKHGYGLGRKDGTSHNYWPKNVEAFILDIVLKP